MFGLDPKKTNCLIVAVNEGTIRAAAEKLDIEPSTISRHISALEKELSTTLIERGRSGVCLTEAGELLARYLRSQTDELDVLRANLDSLAGMQRGTIAIAVGEGFVADLISTALKNFSEQYPGISFELSTGSSDQVIHNLVTGSAHIGLAYNPSNDKRIRKLKRARQPLVLLCAKNAPIAKRPEPISIESLSGEPCALLNQNFGIASIMATVEQRYGIRLNAVVQSDSIAVLKHFVREGMGISFLPQFVVVQLIHDKHVVTRKIDIPEFRQGEAQLLVRQGRKLPKAAILLADHLQHSMSAFMRC